MIGSAEKGCRKFKYSCTRRSSGICICVRIDAAFPHIGFKAKLESTGVRGSYDNKYEDFAALKFSSRLCFVIFYSLHSIFKQLKVFDF